MTDLIGQMVTLDNKKYLVICKKVIDNLELYIAAPYDPPPEFKVLQIREGKDGKLQGRLYTGEHCQELLQESAQKEIKEAMEKILRQYKGEFL